MNNTIVEAIVNKQRILVTYNGTERLVEPHAYGLDRNGLGKLRVFQVSDEAEHQGWRLMKEEAITAIKVADETFATPQSGYTQNDKHIPNIYAQL
jgi:hypothetical protein